jgi:hypothetical protein
VQPDPHDTSLLPDTTTHLPPPQSLSAVQKHSSCPEHTPPALLHPPFAQSQGEEEHVAPSHEGPVAESPGGPPPLEPPEPSESLDPLEPSGAVSPSSADDPSAPTATSRAAASAPELEPPEDPAALASMHASMQPLEYWLKSERPAHPASAKTERTARCDRFKTTSMCV